MEQTISLPASWSRGSLLAFRFFFVYFIFYIFPFPLDFFPGISLLFQSLSSLAAEICGLVAKNFLSVEDDIYGPPNGSGDTIMSYVQLLVFMGYSVIITVVWSIADRRRKNYEKLLYWLTILLRYYLATVMISYGLAKIFKTQFPFPTSDRLQQSFGDASPMGLLWTFMGYSTPYNIFTGLGEFVGGFLLFFRRTRLMGALIIIAVMSHVAMLNFAYDVPVKLFSLHLLSMAIFIIAPDTKRLLSIFLLNRPTLPETSHPIYFDSKTKWFYMIGKGLLVVIILTTNTIGQLESRKELTKYFNSANRSDPLPGEFEVESFELNGEIVPPGKMDTRRWKKVIINKKNIDVQSTDGGSIPWYFHGNNHTHKIILLSPDLSTMGNFRFQGDSSSLTLEGILNEDSLKIKLKKTKSGDQFLLVSRGFHWVNESPFNR